MEIVRGGHRAGGLQLREAPRAHVNHAVLLLQWPFDQQDLGAVQDRAIRLKQIRRDDRVGDAG
ncbi:MAG: hypothetical protein ACLQBA_10800 [Candidatus Binataceae bacterium]